MVPSPPSIPSGSFPLTVGVWSTVYSENLGELTVPNYWCTNDIGGLYQHWHFVVPSSGNYVIDVGDKAQPGDIFELYGDFGTGENLLATGSAPASGFCVNKTVGNDLDAGFADPDYSKIDGFALVNDRTYVFRVLQIRSAEDFNFSCTPFDAGEHGIRIRLL